MTRVVARMQTITPANGYYSNVGSRVYDNKTTEIETAKLPAIDVRDAGHVTLDEVIQGNYNKQTHSIFLDIDFRCYGDNAAEQLRKGEADIKKAINTDLTWNGLAINTTLIPGENGQLEFDQSDRKYGSVVIKIEIIYRTTAWLEE